MHCFGHTTENRAKMEVELATLGLTAWNRLQRKSCIQSCELGPTASTYGVQLEMQLKVVSAVINFCEQLRKGLKFSEEIMYTF